MYGGIIMNNVVDLKIGVVAVSRDCFPESLSVNRRKELIKAYKEKYGEDVIYECPICIVESEIHMVQALEDIKKAGCNALVVYLGNFGPEISETLLAKHFDGERVKNSGATKFAKGDVTLGKWLLEAKTKMTPSKSITIQKDWLEKLTQESLFMGKPHSALLFNFGPDQPNYAIINEELFELLVNLLES